MPSIKFFKNVSWFLPDFHIRLRGSVGGATSHNIPILFGRFSNIVIPFGTFCKIHEPLYKLKNINWIYFSTRMLVVKVSGFCNKSNFVGQHSNKSEKMGVISLSSKLKGVVAITHHNTHSQNYTLLHTPKQSSANSVRTDSRFRYSCVLYKTCTIRYPIKALPLINFSIFFQLHWTILRPPFVNFEEDNVFYDLFIKVLFKPTINAKWRPSVCILVFCFRTTCFRCYRCFIII